MTTTSRHWSSWAFLTSRPISSLSTADVTEFIHQWHQAMAAEILDPSEVADLTAYEQSLITAIDADRHLRALTVSPLLCALLCALNRERHTRLPRDRMEVYEAALEMLLVRRDRDRGVELAETPLTRTEKTLLLQDIAFWLVRNGLSDAPAERIVGQVARTAR